TTGCRVRNNIIRVGEKLTARWVLDGVANSQLSITRTTVNGQAEVRQVFNVSKIGTIAGCSVKSGKVIRNSQGRVIRDGVVVYTGKIKSLKRFKDDAREVAAGLECGISIDGFNDIKPNDIIESFSINKMESTDAGFAAASAANKKANAATGA
ncbi:MAG: hypothetical protein WCQ53_04030, partial [bacterium]